VETPLGRSNSDSNIQACLGLIDMRWYSFIITLCRISRMRVVSVPRTVAIAEKIVTTTIDTYFAPNKTVRELHDLMKSGAGVDPLKDFGEAAREERRVMPFSTPYQSARWSR
jgi:hypothetical protein